MCQVCNDAFGASSAATVCMHLGLGTRGRTYIVPSTNDSLPVLAESFECAEGSSLANCTYQADHNCQHSEDIGLACETGEPGRRLPSEGAERRALGTRLHGKEHSSEYGTAGRLPQPTFSIASFAWRPTVY